MLLGRHSLLHHNNDFAITVPAGDSSLQFLFQQSGTMAGRPVNVYHRTGQRAGNTPLRSAG